MAHKRKRTQPSSPWPYIQDTATNPFSRSPDERRQLSLAGLSDTDADPTPRTKDFPHRRLDRRDQPTTDSDAGPRRPRRRAESAACAGRLDLLLRSAHDFLDRGDVVKAARAYGLLLQLRPGSRPIDVRNHGIWALGAEILMREEGQALPHELHRPPRAHDAHAQSFLGQAGLPTGPAWGSVANMDKVKAYFGVLIRQYPYDHRSPASVSALDFHLAMMGCEVYSVHAEHTAALARAVEEAHARSDQHLDGGQQPDEASGDLDGGLREPDEASGEGSAHQPRFDPQRPRDRDRQESLEAAKEKLRVQALVAMRDITRRMDTLMQAVPYSTDAHFLRLRATASLYTADLVVPASQTTGTKRREADMEREMERRVAVEALGKALESGVELDGTARAILSAETEAGEEHPSPSPPHSSLPIRQM